MRKAVVATVVGIVAVLGGLSWYGWYTADQLSARIGFLDVRADALQANADELRDEVNALGFQLATIQTQAAPDLTDEIRAVSDALSVVERKVGDLAELQGQEQARVDELVGGLTADLLDVKGPFWSSFRTRSIAELDEELALVEQHLFEVATVLDGLLDALAVDHPTYIPPPDLP